MTKDKETSENYITIKLEQSNVPQFSKESVKIKRITSSISPSNFIRLLRYANNAINPRNAIINKIVYAIQETLEHDPELFWFKSKGLVIATKHCSVLERNRVKISLYNPECADDLLKRQEGIMDGGHNAFAIAFYIANKLFDDLKKWKKWDDCKQFWTSKYDEILERFDEMGGDQAEAFRFSIPVEIISPADENDAAEYCDAISEICNARNNNAQLGQSAKDNQEGCYDYLKSILPADKYSIIWKPGQQEGNIHVEDVVSMAVIPLIFLQNIGRLDPGIGTLSKVSIYSQKNQCVKFFSKVVSNPKYSDKPKGSGKYILKSGLIKSAFNMTEDIMKFFDLLYEKFPDMYNAAGGCFGRITDVKIKQNKNFLFKTRADAQYRYSYGFFYPLLCGITELMEYNKKTDTVNWKVNPASQDFKLEELDIKLFTGFFAMSQYNPNVIGKSASFYDAASVAYQSYMLKHTR